MGNNGIVQCEVTFVQASCFINSIFDNNSIIVWKTIFFLQTCATREYDVITMLVLTDVFPRAPFENRFVYLLFSSHLQTGRGVIWRHFTLLFENILKEFRPPEYTTFSLYEMKYKPYSQPIFVFSFYIQKSKHLVFTVVPYQDLRGLFLLQTLSFFLFCFFYNKCFAVYFSNLKIKCLLRVFVKSQVSSLLQNPVILPSDEPALQFLTETIWAKSWENLFLPYANNKGADQPAHPRSLISAFVVHCLDSIIPLLLAIAKFPR